MDRTHGGDAQRTRRRSPQRVGDGKMCMHYVRFDGTQMSTHSPQRADIRHARNVQQLRLDSLLAQAWQRRVAVDVVHISHGHLDAG